MKRIKKYVSLILAAVMIIGSSAVTASASSAKFIRYSVSAGCRGSEYCQELYQKAMELLMQSCRDCVKYIPSAKPTAAPAAKPTAAPGAKPTAPPTEAQTAPPAAHQPTQAPVAYPTDASTDVQTQPPTETPTQLATEAPQQTESAYELNSNEIVVVELINQIRADNGLKELTIDRDLSRVARLKSQDMHDKRYFSHNSPTYGTPFEMMKQFGIIYRTAGENIAMGYRSAQSVVDGWMNSEGHRKNILNPSFTKIGMGYVSDGNYWTQMFTG